MESKRARKEGREAGAAYVVPGRRRQDELDAAVRDKLTLEVGLHPGCKASGQHARLGPSRKAHALHLT